MSRAILLTGKTGQLGFELRRALSSLGELVAADRAFLNLEKENQIRQRIQEIKPALIVNAAAYTAVDWAEEEPKKAQTINAQAVRIMAEEAKKIGAPIVHYSTDYVFDGKGEKAWTEEDAPAPLSVYGRTKWEGEQALVSSGVPHLIFRTSWVFGVHGDNFVKKILKLAREKEELSIVEDQIGSPTSSRFIAAATRQVLDLGIENWTEFLKERGGLFHLCCEGTTSWFGFAREILQWAKEEQWPVKVKNMKPIPTEGYPFLAKRPLNSRLNCEKLKKSFSIEPPSWRDELREILKILDPS